MGGSKWAAFLPPSSSNNLLSSSTSPARPTETLEESQLEETEDFNAFEDDWDKYEEVGRT